MLQRTTSHSDEDTENLYNTIDKILEKQTHYIIVMVGFKAKLYWISSDTHQLQLIKLHQLKIERFKSI